MSVDFEAIAQRGRCDSSSLKLAQPLLEQGFSPPFLARYRSDELGGLSESNLWALSAAIDQEKQVAQRRDELHAAWQQTALRDPALGQAIKKSNSSRMLARLGRRLKTESNEQSSDSVLLAVRVLNPQKGDGSDFAEIAKKIEGIQDVDVAVEGLKTALAKRLAGDPRIIASAVRWLVKNAQIKIANVSDPHTPQEDPASAKSDPKANQNAETTPEKTVTESAEIPAGEAPAPDASDSVAGTDAVSAPDENSSVENSSSGDSSQTEASVTENQADVAEESVAPGEATEADTATDAVAASEPEVVTAAENPEASNAAADDASAETAPAEEQNSGASDSVAEQSAPEEVGFSAEQQGGQATSGKPKSSKAESNAPKKQKKISPRQRRRRWLVSILKPLAGKRFPCDKLSAFQIVMLGRALRSQVAECSFEYDAAKLVAELQRTASGINRHVDAMLAEIVLANEAVIREAAEAVWWDDLHERASARLVGITAEHLRRHVNRGAVEAKVVMAIDAVGPRTAATSIVAADGRLLHKEDLPCQLSSATRSQAVARMGELIHAYHVDLLVISNGPARRATMIALGDLIGQSPEKSLRWTLADRSGADAYASSGVADEEMRATPRRFRAAAWLAFSVLQPAQALAKVDPLKLRLSSFQRELSDEAILSSLEDVLVSGASRGGVDVNSAPVSWLQRLPGVQESVAKEIDRSRRESLFASRQAIIDIDQWGEATHSRQAIPFLRVFGSEEELDGTLIHPDDYPLARKLAKALEIELPPSAPQGYQPPDYSVVTETTETKLAEATAEPEKSEVEDFSSATSDVPEFQVENQADENQATESGNTESENTESESTQTLESAEPGQEGNDAQTPAASDDSGDVDQEAVTESGKVEEDKPSVEQLDASVASDSDASSNDAAESQGDAADESASDAGNGIADSAAEQAAEQAAEPEVAVEVAERIRRPRPDQAKIDKCVKEWQIGSKRANQLVQWLCDPFGDSDSSGDPPAVLSIMPSIKSLKQGDSVVGVVVGVMPFGVFVELAPDCSGLIHVSRVSDAYVEDLHEAVQVGDVITAWVTGIDEKRRRVALTAVSPQREAELKEARRNRDDRSRGGGQGRRGGGQGSRGQGQGSGGQNRGGQSRGGQSRGDRAGSAGSGRPGGGRGREQGRGGRSRDGGGRGRGGRGRERKPESYRVVGKKETKPISDAMQKGEEPLRSFGDLMQFYSGPASNESAQEKKPGKKKKDSKPDSGDEAVVNKDANSSSETDTKNVNASEGVDREGSENAKSPQATESASQPASESQASKQDDSASPPASDNSAS